MRLLPGLLILMLKNTILLPAVPPIQPKIVYNKSDRQILRKVAYM